MHIFHINIPKGTTSVLPSSVSCCISLVLIILDWQSIGSFCNSPTLPAPTPHPLYNHHHYYHCQFFSIRHRKTHQSFDFSMAWCEKRLNSNCWRTGPCLTIAIWRCRKPFSQWQRSFQRKLHSHWLNFLHQRHVAVVRQRLGSCITNVIATCRKNFSQWERSFIWKLRCHWLKFLRHVAKTLVMQGPAGVTSLVH